MSLLVNKKFISHSGKNLNFKIECDSLTDEDLETIAAIIANKFKFKYVHGVPGGGIPLAFKLHKYLSPIEKNFIIVDDVLTTGSSMEESRKLYHRTLNIPLDNIIGVVIFSRGICPNWINPIFQLSTWVDL